MTLYPWRRKTIEHIKDLSVVAWTDEDAYQRFPEFSWVYDKLEIAERFCPLLTIDLTQQYPKKYPAFIKPKSKLSTEKKVFVATCKEDIDKELPNKTNYISQATLSGEHITSDYIIKDGKILDKIRFICHRDKNNSFYLMERLKSSEFDMIELIIMSIGLKFGIINVETIGGVIANVHLTPTIGVHDISSGFTEQLPRYLQTKQWKQCKYQKTYSRIYKRSKDSRPILLRSLPQYPEGVCSVTLCWDENKKLSDYYQDESSYRYMIINGTDLDVIEEFGRDVLDCIEFKDI